MATLTLELPAGIIYVAGRVNGVLTVFHQDGINPWRWRASVDAAEDSLYHICLEMHDEAGNVGYFEKVLEYILPVFVYDRTREDVEYAEGLHKTGWQDMTEEQRKAWRGGLKGCLNASDLKRMENAVYLKADRPGGGYRGSAGMGRRKSGQPADRTGLPRRGGNHIYCNGI